MVGWYPFFETQCSTLQLASTLYWCSLLLSRFKYVELSIARHILAGPFSPFKLPLHVSLGPPESDVEFWEDAISAVYPVGNSAANNQQNYYINEWHIYTTQIIHKDIYRRKTILVIKTAQQFKFQFNSGVKRPMWADTRINTHSLTPYLCGYYWTSSINFLNLPWSIISSLFSCPVRWSFSTTSLQAFFGPKQVCYQNLMSSCHYWLC